MEKSPKKKSSQAVVIILYIILILGAGILLYPTLADYWNSRQSARTTEGYQKTVDTTDEDELNELWDEAQEYNQQLYRGTLATQSEEAEETEAYYNSLLNLKEDGMMGTIEIPAIKVSLPIYHTSTQEVLQTSVGHVEQSSLPVGGESTHCVLSAHRGNPSAKLFTNLDMLQEGDVFLLNVLNRTLTYEVDQIYVVEPEDTSHLKIVTGEDRCTLVTCTPYGINTHRLLVCGHRIENVEETSVLRITADAIQIEPIITAPLAAIPWILLMMICLLVSGRRRKKLER